MIRISEKLNSSIPAILTAFEQKNEAFLIDLIQKQEAAQADYIDINTALLQEKELETMLYTINLVKKHSAMGIMIDSPTVSVIEKAVEAAQDRSIIINSVTLTDRINELIPLLQQNPDISVVGLPIPKTGIPTTAEERVQCAEELIQKLTDNGISEDRIFIDVLVEALAVGDNNAKIALDTLRLFKQKHPNIKTTGGFSNVSFGLPKRIIINTAFLAMAMYAGLDSAIMDVASDTMKKSYRAINALLGNDEYCMDYIEEIRSQEE